jgi:ribosome-binding factor A
MSKEFSRLDRIGDQIKRELAVIIQRHVKSADVGMVSVTDVKVSRDLAHAKVYVSLLLEDEKIPAAVRHLNDAAKQLRYLLAQTIELRMIPELKFYYDDTIVRGTRIANLIDEVTKKSPDSSDQ